MVFFLSTRPYPTLLLRFLRNKQIIWVSFMSGSIGTLDSLGSTGELQKMWTVCKLSEPSLTIRGQSIRCMIWGAGVG